MVRSQPVPCYHYVILRRDLPLGLIVAQTVHAAGESSPGNLPPDTRAVALAVDNEAALKAVDLRLRDAGVMHKPIIEVGGGFDGQLMAIGCAPTIDRALVRKVLSEVPLLR